MAMTTCGEKRLGKRAKEGRQQWASVTRLLASQQRSTMSRHMSVESCHHQFANVVACVGSQWQRLQERAGIGDEQPANHNCRSV